MTVASTGNTVPNAAVIATGDMDELYEGVLIQVVDAIANYIDGSTWSVYNGTVEDSLTVYNGEFSVSYTPEMNHHYNVTGIGKWYNGGSIYEILPRDVNDIEDVTNGIAPVITNVMTDPANPTNADAVSVSADVTDDGTVETVTLFWGTDAASITNEINMSAPTGDTYTTDSDIPAQDIGTTVYYYVSATDDQGLNETTDVADYTVIGIDEFTANAVAIYPNPSKDKVTIETGVKGKYIVNLYSVIGELVYSEEIESDRTIINVNNFEKGIYQVQIIDAASKLAVIKKLVVK